MTQRLTHSRASCFRSCPRRHYLAYELGLRRIVDGYALRVGSAFHAAREALDLGNDPGEAIEQWMDDPFDMALVAAMLDGHTRRWANHPLEVVATEIEFDLPLINPQTGKPTPIWNLAGKIDGVVRLPDGRLALHEYKTTSKDFSPDSDYWMALHLDQQLSLYLPAARSMGYDISTILYDVTLRPSIRPLKATPVEKRKYTKTDHKLYANQREFDETPEEYAARAAAYMMEHIDTAYARIEIARLEQDLDDCQAEIWQQQLAIRAMQRAGAGAWYRNPQACFEPYPCTYLHICQNRDLETVTPEGFRRSADIHPELLTIAA